MKNLFIRYCILAISFSFTIFLQSCEPKLSNEARKKFVPLTQSDSILTARQFGNINFLKFKQLLADSKLVDTTKEVERCGDSIHFHINKPELYRLYLGISDNKNDATTWIKKYKNLPITIVKGKYIAANLVKNNGKEYITIPYEMLSCVVERVGNRPDSKLVKQKEQDEKNQNERITFKDTTDINKKAVGGNKIQVEGFVLKNVSDILASCKCTQGDKECQMLALYNYAHDNWIYIYDPAIEQDMWRSASETIENYYFTANHKYTGDCDDFAILMASFARQIGYQSRFVAEWGNNGGHAHAEYSSDGHHWYSLDWDGTAGQPIEKRHKCYPYSKIYYNL